MGLNIVAIIGLSAAVAAALPNAQPIITDAPATGALYFQRWQPGAIICSDGRAAAGDMLVEPAGQVRRYESRETKPVTVGFTIDAMGRAVDIDFVEAAPQRAMRDSDILPALAASQFAASGKPATCSLTYAYVSTEMTEAPLLNMAVANALDQRSLPRLVRQRLVGGDCNGLGRLYPVTLSYPDLRDAPSVPGEPSFAYVGFDVDAQGITRNVRLALSSGNDAIDRETMRAVTDSRFRGGARTGCLRGAGKRAARVAAPDMPAGKPVPGDDARCQASDRWDQPPVLSYPPAHRKRGIEGWALVRYDVAPWGETGGVNVIASQPSGEFGRAAMAMVSRAKFKPLQAGLSGCVEKFVFRMTKDDDGGPDTAPEELADNQSD